MGQQPASVGVAIGVKQGEGAEGVDCKAVTQGLLAQVRSRVARDRGGKKTRSKHKKWGGVGWGPGGRLDSMIVQEVTMTVWCRRDGAIVILSCCLLG